MLQYVYLLDIMCIRVAKRPLMEVVKMAVKHVPTGVVHKGVKGGKTGCGVDTGKNTSHWESTSLKITCDKNGCKN